MENDRTSAGNYRRDLCGLRVTVYVGVGDRFPPPSGFFLFFFVYTRSYQRFVRTSLCAETAELRYPRVTQYILYIKNLVVNPNRSTPSLLSCKSITMQNLFPYISFHGISRLPYKILLKRIGNLPSPLENITNVIYFRRLCCHTNPRWFHCQFFRSTGTECRRAL